MACRPALVWGGIIAAGVAAEVHALACKHHDCTLSALTREVFRTDSTAGRVAFIAGSALVAIWFQYHIVAWERRELDKARPPRAVSPPVLSLVGKRQHRQAWPTRPAR